MNPKFYILGGYLVLLTVAIAPTFTNDPIPERRMHVQTFKVETSTSSQAVQSSSESSSATSSTSFLTVEKPTTTLSPTTIPTIVTTTTMVLSVTENITTTSVTLSVLQTAQNLIGKSRTELGFTPWWCTELTNYIFQQVGRPEWINEMASPGQQKSLMPSTDLPQPGDLVFISFFKNGQTDHVAIVESVNEDGSLNTIEGNGPDREYVARGVRFSDEVTGYGNTHE